MIGSGVSQAAGLLVALAALNTLSINEFGSYSLALAIALITNALVDGGLSQYLITEYKKSPELREKIYKKFQALQLTNCLASILVTALISLFIDSETAFILWIFVGGFIVGSLINTSFSLIIVDEKYSYILIKDLISSAVKFAMAVWGAYGGGNVFYFASITAVSQIVCAVFILIFKKKIQIPYMFKFEFDRKKFGLVYANALPYILLTLSNLIFNKVDVIMLDIIAGKSEVAIFSAATQFVYPFMFIVTAMATALFPLLVDGYSKNDARYIIKLSQKIFSAVGLAISIALYAVGDFVFQNIGGGKYILSEGVFQIFVWYIFLVFIYSPQTNRIIALGKVALLVKLNIVMAVVSVVLNGIVIPYYGAKGAAVVSVCCEILIIIWVHQILMRLER